MPPGGRVAIGCDAVLLCIRFDARVRRDSASGSLRAHAQEALGAATGEVARVLGVDDIGAIETGRAGVLVVVDKGPVQNIRARNVVVMLRDGRLVVDHEASDAEHEDGRPRQAPGQAVRNYRSAVLRLGSTSYSCDRQPAA